MLDKVDPSRTPPGPAAPEADARERKPAPASLPTPIARAEPAVRRLEAQRERRRSLLAAAVRVVFQIVLMLAVLAGAAWFTMRLVADKPERRSRPVFTTVYTVETAVARQATYRPDFVAYGQTVAGRAVDLRALVGGEIVAVSPNLQPGAAVAEGEALVSIDPFQYEGAVVEAQSGLDEARARIAQGEARIAAELSKETALAEQLALAQDDLARAERLRSRRQGTQQQVDTRQLVVSQRQQALDAMKQAVAVERAGLEQLRAGLPRLEFAVERAKRNLESTVLRAPFAGVVRAAAAEPGRLVSANDVVVSLYDQNRIEARFTLNDARFGRLQGSQEPLVGREVAVVWSVGGRDHVYPARIERLGAEIASARGGVEVFARLDDTNGAGRPAIRPGAFVEVRVPDIAYRDVFALPDTALFENGRVYVVVDGKLVARTVEVAAFADDRVLVSEGLEEGERVLVTRIAEVGEGLSVREEGEAAPAKGNAEAADDETPDAGERSDDAGGERDGERP